jgi:acetoin:2,6-dichlorophenolindophenol oxidoreductase subunit alpha
MKIMRSKNFGTIKNISRKFPRKTTLDMFKKICLIRNFEFNVKDAFDKKLMKMPIYLSVGQESIASALSIAFPGAYQFGQHRCHDLYLAYGGDTGSLIDELLHKPTGCAKGWGGSASIHSPKTGMYGHDGLMGTQIPIATGFALGSNKKTLAIMGDASAEEDYVMGALGYASRKRLPILFVCADNGLSILTEVNVRRNWKMANLSKSFGMNSIEITDDPWLIMHHAKQLNNTLPAFMNIHVCRHLWHAGTGTDGPPEWNRFELIKKEMNNLGLSKQAGKIELETKNYVNKIWQRKLKKLKS